MKVQTLQRVFTNNLTSFATLLINATAPTVNLVGAVSE